MTKQQQQQAPQAPAPQAPPAKGHEIDVALATADLPKNGDEMGMAFVASIMQQQARMMDMLAQQQKPVVVPANQVPADAKKVEVSDDDTKRAVAIHILTLKRLGYWEEALKLEKKGEKASFFEEIGARADGSVTWRHLGYVAVGAAGVYLVYEGLAMWFDWPSFELVFKKNPIAGPSPVAPNGAVPLKR